MWKARVKNLIEMAIAEVIKETNEEIDPNSTIRTELDHMVFRTRMADLEQRLRQMLIEVEAVPEVKTKKPEHGG